MIGNRVHILELLLVNFAISSRTRFGNLATLDTSELAGVSLIIKLCSVLCLHLGLDANGFFTHAVHDLLRFRTEIRFGTSEAKVEARR